MTRTSAALLGFCSALALGISQARAAAVIWDFVETSCFPFGNGSCTGIDRLPPLPLPAVVATFTSPDPTGQFYDFDLPNQPPPFPLPLPIQAGDTNFVLQWQGTLAPPVCGCELDIVWDGPPTRIDYMDDSTNIDLVGGSGNIGADYFIAGCGVFKSCAIGGDWVDAADLPEVGSVELLGVGLGLFAFVWQAKRRTR